MLRAGIAIATVACGLGCESGTTPTPEPAPHGSAAAVAKGRVEIVPGAAEPADLAKVVASELERARADGKDLIVYAGAEWCEPCKYFHDAAASGQLDEVFPRLRLLEFDLDRDQARLEAAGYGSKMVPLFAVPGPDGRGTGKQIEGSVKGPGAVRQITPRLRQLLAR
jgi:hypothetical protein